MRTSLSEMPSPELKPLTLVGSSTTCGAGSNCMPISLPETITPEILPMACASWAVYIAPAEVRSMGAIIAPN